MDYYFQSKNTKNIQQARTISIDTHRMIRQPPHGIDSTLNVIPHPRMSNHLQVDNITISVNSITSKDRKKKKNKEIRLNNYFRH